MSIALLRVHTYYGIGAYGRLEPRNAVVRNLFRWFCLCLDWGVVLTPSRWFMFALSVGVCSRESHIGIQGVTDVLRAFALLRVSPKGLHTTTHKFNMCQICKPGI